MSQFLLLGRKMVEKEKNIKKQKKRKILEKAFELFRKNGYTDTKVEDITKASEKRPVIYCRLNSAELVEQTNTVLWLDGKIAIHILCPDSEVRLKIAMDIAQRISLEGEIILIDKSPMFINKLQMDNKSDYLKEGQIFITGRYGILRYKAKPNELNKIHNNYG